jgi:MFS family permease
MSKIDANLKRRLERNLIKYAWMQPLIMRVYYPILGVYLVSVGQLSLSEIATVTIITALLDVIFQLPAGYFADKYGTRKALKLGSLLSLTSPLWYVFFPGFFGAVMGLSLFRVGNVFIGNGTSESLIHDTLIKLGREKEYSKVMGRAQSRALLANLVLVSLVPLTYPLWWPAPFVIGFVAQVAVFLLIRSYEYPDLPRLHTVKTPLKAFKSVVNLGNVAVFLFCGFIAALGFSSATGEYLQLRLEDMGLLVGMLGVVQAGGSLIGAGLGLIIHKFDKIRLRTLCLLELLVISAMLATIGYSQDLVVVAVTAIIFMGWIRVRKIIFQAKLLAELKHVYKATLISALSFFVNIFQMIAPALLAWSVLQRDGQLGGGYVLFAGIVLVIGSVLWIFVMLSAKRKDAKISRRQEELLLVENGGVISDE